MSNSQLRKKILSVVVVFALALCVGLCAFLGIKANSSGGKFVVASENNFGVLNSADGNGDNDVDFTYIYGQSYNINGTTYRIGVPQPDYIPFKVALGLSDTDTVTLTKFTNPDGSNGTYNTGGIRKIGLYEFNVTTGGTNKTLKLQVLGKFDYSTTDNIPVFVNATSVKYKAHGDITAIYKHNDGWYPSQKADEIPVEIRTITNAYYYETGNPVTIRIANESFAVYNDYTSATSTLPYTTDLPGDNSVTINITNRSGVRFTAPDEYVATFTFNAPKYCTFTYGDADDDDEIIDKNKGLSITQRTPTSFVVTKHWFIVKYASLFVAQDDVANYPYVPFHDPERVEAADGKTTDDTSDEPGGRGELNTAVDTITYGEDVLAKAPVARFNSGCYKVRADGKLNTDDGPYKGTNYELNSNGNPIEIIKDGTTKFDVIYVDLNGVKHRVATQVPLDATGSVAQNTLSYYFNKTMPAGHYTLKLYGEIAASEVNKNLPEGYPSRPNKIQGEYWLTVLPAPLSSSLITGTGGIQDIIKGEQQSNGSYLNSYLLSEEKLHESLSDKITEINGTLNANLGQIVSYWNDKSEYFESAVTIKYNRDSWSASTYVTETEIKQMITQAGNYTLYYSIAAKNYVTVGGPEDANRTAYGFTTRLSAGVSIKQIADRVYNNNDPYFKDVTYTGGTVQTLVPQSQQYTTSFNDKGDDGNPDYTNVRERATVTLALYDTTELLTGWENDLPDGNLGDRIELSADKQTLTVYFDIAPATNSWTVAPQMSPWTYDSYNKDINFITDGLAFDGAEVYYRLGKRVNGEYQWVDIGGTLTVNGEVAPEYFAVGADGKVSNEVAAKLNALGAGTYYLCGYINPSQEVNGTYNVNGYLMPEQAYATVVVMQAANSWETTPYILDWAYSGFNPTNFQAGETVFGKNDENNEITYTLYVGNPTTGTLLKTFKTLDDVVDGEKISDTLNTLDVDTYTLVASKAGSDDYRPLSLQMTFVVYKATNAWTITPFINSWTYRKFTSDNVRAGEAAFGVMDEATGKNVITYKLYEGDTVTETSTVMYTFTGLTDTVKIDGKDVIVLDMFIDLPAKTYTIVASVDDTDNYGGLSMTITFAVTKASNTWTTMPIMTSWAYNLFTAGNFQAGVTELGVIGTVTYTLYNGTATTGAPLRTLAALTETYTLTQDDIDYFKILEKGTYTLVAHQRGSDDYGELNQYMTFSVTQATNTWTVTPYITGWTYKQFTANNFQAGETEFGVKSTITYTLYAGDKAEGTALKTFGAITDEGVIDCLTALSKGTYTLLAHQGGTESYGVLNTPLTFTVTPTTNSWATKPRVIGWVYGAFVDSYFIAGVPTLQESMENDVAAEVKYILTKDGDDSFTPVTFTESELYDFASLNAGTYKLNVSYAGTVNYGKLDADEITFNVSQTGNNWQNATPPDISGWTYGAFADSLFTDGTAIHGSTTYTVYKVVNGTADTVVKIDGVALSEMSYATLKAKLNALNADTYTIQATSGSTPEYTAATWSKQFVVAKANNEWGDNTPSINGWTYGGTPATPNNGTAKYESADATVTGKYYLTTTDGNGNLIADMSKPVSGNVENAGSYAYVLTVADTTNYNGFTTTLFFTVDKAANDWTTSPAGSYSWTWGEDIATLTANITGAAVTNGTVSFDIVKTGGGYTMPTGTISEILEALTVGEYTVTVTVTTDNNHVEVAPAVAYIMVNAAQLTVTDPACAGWTWGVDDDDKVFTDIVVVPAKVSDNVTVQYQISSNNTGWTDPIYSYNDLLDDLNDRPAGDYRVRITATCANHESVTRTVSFTVGKATLTWSGEQTDVEWEWNDNWQTTDGGRDISDLTAKGCNNADAALSYTINGATYADFGAVKAYLQSNERTAGTYTVKVSATLANHETEEKTFTVTVKVAQNEWINEPEASYEMVYNEWATLPATTAKFGTVVYTCGSENITNVNNWIKTLNAQTYVLTLSVAGVNNQYGALTKQVIITVKSAGSQWANQNQLSADNEDTYNAVYGTAEHSALKDTIKFPIGTAGGTTTYSVFVNGSETAAETYTTLAGIQSYFTSALAAGTYVIKAEFTPTSVSYAKLSYTITAVVEKAEVDWASGHKLEQGDPQTYLSVTLPDPQADKDIAAVTVTVVNSKGETLDMGGKSLSAFVADLGAGMYTITAAIADSDNYTIVGDQTTTIALYITAIQNEWTNVTEDDKTITAEEWTDGYTWTFTRGDNISVMLPAPVIGETAITFDGITFNTIAALNEYLNRNLAANTTGYSLVFSVDATANYTGLVSNCVVVINKKANDWTQELESVNKSGAVNTATFVLPTADVYRVNGVDLRIYNIVKAGARPNSDWYTEDDFLTELSKLVNGTYTITARIGGDYRPATADSSFTQALNLYNADYAELVCTCTVTLTPDENAWITKLSDKSWTWGDTVSVTLSEAAYGSDQIIYTISGNGISTITVNTSDGGVLTALNNAVNGLHPGTYTIAASIVGTDLYSAPTESNVALLTVSKYAASWNGYTDDELAAYAVLNVTWKQATSSLLPTLTVKYMKVDKTASTVGATVVWKIGKYSFDDIIEALNEREAGPYTVTATYAGDDYNEELTFTAIVTVDKAEVVWSSATVNADKQYNWTLNSTTNTALTQPTLYNAGDCAVTYTLVKVGSTGTLYSGDAWSGTNSLSSVLAAQKAGTYEITAKASGNENYVLPADVTYMLTISAEPNDWTTKPAATVTWTYKSTTNTVISFVPAHNADKLIITVGGDTVSASDLMNVLKGLGVGSHSIVASVSATDEYAAIEPYTVTLTIEPATDTFGTYNVPASWAWDDVSQKTDVGGIAWQTEWNTTLTVPVPAVNSTATAIVYSAGSSAEQFAATLHYETTDGIKKVLVTDLNALKSKLLGLHVGTYTIEFVVGNSANYNGCKVSATFSVTKATNAWDGSDGVPKIAGWQYDGSVANPTATPKYGKGTVKFSYAKAGTETKEQLEANDSIVTWKDSTDTAEGAYWLRAYVQGTDDYSALVGYVKFNISAGQNGWVNNPGVIAWNWNGYNKTVNLFSGSAKNNGEATFKIYAVGGGVDRNLGTNNFVFNGQAPDKTDDWVVALFNTNGFKLIEENGAMVVSAEVAQWLNALKPATYKLSVVIAADNNYDELTGSATFAVGKAANSWATGKAPAVSSYTYGNYDETTTFTYGETVYGDASAVIYKLDDEKFTSTDGGKTSYQKLQERLETLGAGSYTLSAWVAESANGTYSALYNEGSPYTTRTFTVARATNGWTNETLVTQINKKYSVIKAAAFDQTEFAELYPQLTPIEGTVNYALLTANYTTLNKDKLTYAELFDAIKDKNLPAGEYIIRATVAETTTTNYLGIGATDTRLTISTHDNEFTQIPDALTAQWARGEDENNATVLTAFEVKATYGEETVTYTLNKTTYESYKDFEDAVSALDAGAYNITIAIAATDDYAGLSEVRMLTVSPASNSWQNDWAASGSLSVASTTTKAGLSWGWRSTVTWTKAVPVYGKTVYVEIRKANASSALQYVTLDYGVSPGDSAVATISEAISRLDVGDYELIVSAPATVNWAALSDKVEFSITKVSNDWKVGFNPQLSGAVNNKWEHGDNVIPIAEALYGTVRFEYETKSGDKLTSMPTSAGEYVIKFIVDDTDNYDGISGSLDVTIEKATNRTVANLSVIGWTWGAYDRETNVITGTPEIAELENATVKFSIGTGMDDSFVVLPDLSEFTLTANGLVERDSKVEAALRALKGGTSKENNLTYYTVRIHVSGTTNYNGFTADSRFAVTGATNRIESLTIKTWEVNHWNGELPSAVAMYGAPELTVTGETDGVVYFKGEYRETDDGQLELFEELNDLNLAPKGDYVLTASVKAEIGHYNEPLTRSLPFHIDVKGAGQANYWEVLPTIDGWVANIDGLYNLPTGQPVRGLPNFVFYVRNADGSRGQKVDATLTDVVLKKGNKYEADIYIPVEYGDYILVASSQGIPEEEGKSDALAEYEIRVIIDPRPLSFEQELRIATLLYLGERNDWANPTSKPSLDDAEITYVYTNKDTGVSSTEMPTVAGEYTVTATLSAKYSNNVSMSVDFTVKLSPNGWTAAPNIKDWSEENKGNLPSGAATVGSDRIVYTYASVKEPNKILKEKPKTEGSYIMYADLIVEGYEPLHAEYRFTIEPAFDTQLVIAAIVLGVFACLLACVVIYFAIRRYKEN